MELSNLKQLPDHHRLEHRTDPAGHDDEGIRDKHEMVQSREKRTVLEHLTDERVDLLLEGQVDADAHGTRGVSQPRRVISSAMSRTVA